MIVINATGTWKSRFWSWMVMLVESISYKGIGIYWIYFYLFFYNSPKVFQNQYCGNSDKLNHESNQKNPSTSMNTFNLEVIKINSGFVIFTKTIIPPPTHLISKFHSLNLLKGFTFTYLSALTLKFFLFHFSIYISHLSN